MDGKAIKYTLHLSIFMACCGTVSSCGCADAGKFGGPNIKGDYYRTGSRQANTPSAQCPRWKKVTIPAKDTE